MKPIYIFLALTLLLFSCNKEKASSCTFEIKDNYEEKQVVNLYCLKGLVYESEGVIHLPWRAFKKCGRKPEMYYKNKLYIGKCTSASGVLLM